VAPHKINSRKLARRYLTFTPTTLLNGLSKSSNEKPPRFAIHALAVEEHEEVDRFELTVKNKIDPRNHTNQTHEQTRNVLSVFFV